MRVEVQERIAAPVERVWAWWTDFGKPGESFMVDHGNGQGLRTIHAVEGRVVRFTDHSPLAGDIDRTVELLDGHRMRDVGEGKRPFVSDWAFLGEGEATLVRRVVEFRHPVADALGPLGRWLASRLIRKDLVAHARACEAELR